MVATVQVVLVVQEAVALVEVQEEVLDLLLLMDLAVVVL